jgi:tagatose-6-phosphate ketose/aldose isomerase
MEKYLGFTIEELENKGGLDTAMEISGQPGLWQKTYDLIKKQENEIKIFIRKLLEKDHPQIILTGAGSSAFIGDVLEGPFQKNSRIDARAVATTDLVTHPGNYFQRNTPTLMISFARSGNSPESMAAIQLSNVFCSDVSHLVVTCNPTGQIVRMIDQEKDYLIILPPESNDKGLAMTGSFTSMLLTGILISRIHEIDKLRPTIDRICQYGEKIVREYSAELLNTAKIDFKRAIFLGSGPLFGCARESHLKLQELTDGAIICKHDSFLGFRHGPKAVIDNDSLIVFIFSNDPYVRQYEYDLVKSINNGLKGICRVGIAEMLDQDLELDLVVSLTDEEGEIAEEFLPICLVMPGQILGFYKSVLLGLKPDMPSAKGAITRVVEGVKIYPHPGPYDDEQIDDKKSYVTF